MNGKKTALMGRIRREMYVEIHCIIYQESLCGETLKFKYVMKVVSVVKFIRSHGLNHR
jgi:hypothetical protein